MDASPASHLDCGSCRLRLDAAGRQIARLRRGLLTAAETRLLQGRLPPPQAGRSDRAPDPLSSPPTGRKAYAVDPVGRIPPREPAPPPETPPVRVIDYAYVTSEGSLLDVLA